MKNVSKITTLAALFLLVLALVSLKNGLPNLNLISDSFIWILGGFFIWRLAGGSCCSSKRRCASPEPPVA